MHSRIFQISGSPDTYGCYDELLNEEWFYHSVADYTSDETDKVKDIEWLQGTASGFCVAKEIKGEYFIEIQDKRRYFETKYPAFCKAVQKLSETTIDDFVNGSIDMVVWSLRDAYEDKFGFYVYDANVEFGLMPFDDFVRKCNVGERYYIINTFDYHF